MAGVAASLLVGLPGCAAPGGASRGESTSASGAAPASESATAVESTTAGGDLDGEAVGIGVGAIFLVQAPGVADDLAAETYRLTDDLCTLLTQSGRVCRTDADVRAIMDLVAQRQLLGACEEGACVDGMDHDFALYTGLAAEGSGYRFTLMLFDAGAGEVVDEVDARLDDPEAVGSVARRLTRQILGLTPVP